MHTDWSRRDVEFILNDFHRVSDPRIMTDAYFDMVFEKVRRLEQTGPQPWSTTNWVFSCIYLLNSVDII